MNRGTLLVLLLALGCSPPPQARDARTSYNAGLAMVTAGDYENGIDLLAKARANGGGDTEVRFRAASTMGVAYAAWAEAAVESEPATAVSRYERSESWFRDAIRLRASDENARVNLAIVVRKRRALVDRLGAGDKALEKQLERVLGDQRAIRDELRSIEAAIAGGADPGVLADTLDGLATRQRSLAADAGGVSDIAADERAGIEAVAEAERSPEQKGRLAQLSALSHYLESARGAMADVRRSLRKTLVERGHRRSDAAVSEIVRAREQLMDPAAVIGMIAADEMTLYRETRLLAGLRSGAIALEGGETPALPPHLEGARLAERQRLLTARAAELSARLDAYVDAGAREGESPEAAQTRDVVAKAAPFLAAAVTGMGTVATELDADKAEAAATAEEGVLTNLARALEYFSALRQLIELIAGQQQQAVGLLDPETAKGAQAISTEERQRLLAEIGTLNAERLERLALLLEADKTQSLAQLEQQPAGGEDPDPEQQASARQGIEARFAKAETHRSAALAAVREMSVALGARGADALAPARRAITDIDELRRLFYSLIEHLKELHQRQGTTRDSTSTAQGADDDQRALLIGPLAGLQTEHAAMATQIGEALAAQADQAAAAQQQGQGAMPGAPDPTALAGAADEVRQASTRMAVAQQKLAEAGEAAATMSVDLEPPLADQQAAIEHLAKAIELLSPPKQDPNKDENKDDENKDDENKDDENKDDESQNPEQPQPGQQPQPTDDLSQADVDKRLRAIREREDERRRERERRPRAQTVEKDW